MSSISKAWQEHQRKRWMRPDAARWIRPDAARYLRHDVHRFFPPGENLLLKYSSDQPRVPAGNSDGGQWTSGGANATTSELSAARVKGHHYIPRGVFKKFDLSHEAKEVFENTTTGKLYDPRNNQWDIEHRAYNDAIEENFRSFLQQNGISPSSMTADQAQSFVDQMLTSSDPRIRSYNMSIRMREFLFRLLRGPGRGRE
jgi:hypothetical protein